MNEIGKASKNVLSAGTIRSVIEPSAPDLATQNVVAAIRTIVATIGILVLLGVGVLVFVGAVFAGLIGANRRARRSW